MSHLPSIPRHPRKRTIPVVVVAFYRGRSLGRQRGLIAVEVAAWPSRTKKGFAFGGHDVGHDKFFVRVICPNERLLVRA